jgi:diadenosine tetraphosphatase ApaH/serine/threonine PP2A family protein phosphatase
VRVAVVSDVHSNIVALDAVLAAVGSVDGVWHLGDVVGYGPEPDAVVERLREVGATGVRGNHDTAAAIDPGLLEWFNAEARAAAEWTTSTMTPATRDWLAALPDRHVADGVSLVHGSPRDPLWEYVTSMSVARENLETLAELGAGVGFHGHTHVPIALRMEGDDVRAFRPKDGDELDLDDRPTLLNPGSVGQPRDGNPKASWLVFDTDRRTCAWHRVDYDIATVQEAMHAVHLPPRLAARLTHGL